MYEKQHFVDGQCLCGHHLNHIEDGIVELEKTIENGGFVPGEGGTGKDGEDGFSPIIGVTEIPGGHIVSVTDAKGTQAFNVMDGAPGKDGVIGKDGAPGTNGVSPIVEVEEIEGGHRVKITDINGEKSFDVKDGAGGEVETKLSLAQGTYDFFGQDLTQQCNATRKSLPVVYEEKGKYQKTRIKKLTAYATEAGAVRFDLYEWDGNYDNGTLTFAETIGEANATGAGIVTVEFEEGYITELDKFAIVAVSPNAILGWVSAGGVSQVWIGTFEDGEYYTNAQTITSNGRFEGFTLTTCKWDLLNVGSVEEAINNCNPKPVSHVELSQYKKKGIITETYEDGKQVTYNIEFDTEGRPMYISDSNGSRTAFNWW